MVLKIHHGLYSGHQQAAIWHIILMLHSVRGWALTITIRHNNAQMTLAQNPETQPPGNLPFLSQVTGQKQWISQTLT